MQGGRSKKYIDKKTTKFISVVVQIKVLLLVNKIYIFCHFILVNLNIMIIIIIKPIIQLSKKHD